MKFIHVIEDDGNDFAKNTVYRQSCTSIFVLENGAALYGKEKTDVIIQILFHMKANVCFMNCVIWICAGNI